MKRNQLLRIFYVLLLLLCLGLFSCGALADEEEAKNGSTVYATLQEAIDAASSGDVLVVLKDVELTDGLEVAADKDFCFDLAGHRVRYQSNETTGNAALTNRGSMVLLDSVGGGKLAYSSSKPSADFSYATNAITNYGTLTVSSGSIENSTAGASYGVDNIANSAVKLTVNGGTITASSQAIRAFGNSAANSIQIDINGGTLTGSYAVQIQLPGSNSASAPAVKLNVTGGTLIPTNTSYPMAVYSYSYGNSYNNVEINISGGDLQGWVAIGGGSANGGNGAEKLRITGGYVSDVFTYNDDTPHDIYLTGGLYDYEPYDPSYYEGQTVIRIEVEGREYWTIGKDAVNSENIPDNAMVHVIAAGEQMDLNIQADGVEVFNWTDKEITVNGRITVPALPVGAEAPVPVPIIVEPSIPDTKDGFMAVLWGTVLVLALGALPVLMRARKQD